MKAELMTISQFCEAINCGRTYAYQLINQKKIKALKNGKRTLIRRADMEDWIQTLEQYQSHSGAK